MRDSLVEMELEINPLIMMINDSLWDNSQGFIQSNDIKIKLRMTISNSKVPKPYQQQKDEDEKKIQMIRARRIQEEE